MENFEDRVTWIEKNSNVAHAEVEDASLDLVCLDDETKTHGRKVNESPRSLEGWWFSGVLVLVFWVCLGGSSCKLGMNSFEFLAIQKE